MRKPPDYQTVKTRHCRGHISLETTPASALISQFLHVRHHLIVLIFPLERQLNNEVSPTAA